MYDHVTLFNACTAPWLELWVRGLQGRRCVSGVQFGGWMEGLQCELWMRGLPTSHTADLSSQGGGCLVGCDPEGCSTISGIVGWGGTPLLTQTQGASG